MLVIILCRIGFSHISADAAVIRITRQPAEHTVSLKKEIIYVKEDFRRTRSYASVWMCEHEECQN